MTHYPDPPETYVKVIEFLKQIGVPFRNANPNDTKTYDGTSVIIRGKADFILHEAAHYLVSSPEQRSYPEFDLVFGTEKGRFQENLALVLGAHFCVELGVPIWPIYNLLNNDKNRVYSAIQPLKERRLLTLVKSGTTKRLMDLLALDMYTEFDAACERIRHEHFQRVRSQV